MQSSAARREKLFGPLNLALVAGLFAGAFFLLLPDKEKLVTSALDETQPAAPVNDLDLAYLKADAASSSLTDTQLANAVITLSRAGKPGEARDLLRRRPGLQIDKSLSLLLELELAVSEYETAGPLSLQTAPAQQLQEKLELLLATGDINDRALLLRATSLSERLGQSDLTASLYRKLASGDTAGASQWLKQCGDVLAASARHVGAAGCYREALGTEADPDGSFELKLAYMQQVSLSGNSHEAALAIDKLLSHRPLTVEQKARIATSALAAERPEFAHPVFAELARTDSDNAIGWYEKASEWAVAANNTEAATLYIDESIALAGVQQARELTQKKEQLLISANRSNEAYASASARIDEQIRDASVSRESLVSGIVIARAVGDLDKALHYNEKLLELEPDNLEAIENQVSLSIDKADLNAAAVWSAYGVSVYPQNHALREKLAYISEWNGDPVAALEHWLWLVMNRGDNTAYEQTVRLAELNRLPGLAATSLENLLMRTPPDAQQLEKLVALYELEGSPDEAASAIDNIIAVHGASANRLRIKAGLYMRHVRFRDSLSVWEQHASLYGRSSTETLQRMELHWRLGDADKSAELADFLPGNTVLSDASDFQLKMLAEVAWRYRKPQVGLLVQPKIAELENKADAIVLGRRLLQSLNDAGRRKQAAVEAGRLWLLTGAPDIALTAMDLAFRVDDPDTAKLFMNVSGNDNGLQQIPGYWTLLAAMHIRQGELEQGRKAYLRALAIEPGNTQALTGLLWLHIDINDTQSMEKFLVEYSAIAETTPSLWSPYAIAWLQLGQAAKSLAWFERQSGDLDSDYNLLLTYADALEAAGRADDAFRARAFALQKLRPLLSAGAADDQGVLLRQYLDLLGSYGGADETDYFVEQLLAIENSGDAGYDFWREDIAISWLMATQRHEHAQMIMATIHDQRLRTPVWQTLAVAMNDEDHAAVEAVLANSGNELTRSNAMLAMSMVGRDTEALRLARMAIGDGRFGEQRETALSQYAALRAKRPSFSAAQMSRTDIKNLGITQSGVSVQHTLAGSGVGFGISALNRRFSSDRLDLQNNSEQTDVAFTMSYAGRNADGELTLGFTSTGTQDAVYARSGLRRQSVDGRRRLSADIDYNVAAGGSAELRVAAVESRVTIAFEQGVREHEFIKLKADANQISTRVSDKRVARGLGARVEYGLRGAFGSNNWSASVAADRSSNQRENLPDELRLSPVSTRDSVLADSATVVSVGASLSRGGPGEGYPQASSPRYYMNASVGHSWPDKSVGMQLNAGAGIRVLGGDELSFGVSHDTRPTTSLTINNASSLGVNYRYNFK